MSFDRRSIRLPEYDYRQSGAYFVTLVTAKRANWFGEIIVGKMNVNEMGQLVEQEWKNLPRHFSKVDSDVFIVMPNHFHGILWITSNEDRDTGQLFQETVNTPIPYPGNRGWGLRAESLGAIIGSFKSITSRRINGLSRRFGESIWQRNYYEHVIRNQEDLTHAREYILNNPMQWPHDSENTAL